MRFFFSNVALGSWISPFYLQIRRLEALLHETSSCENGTLCSETLMVCVKSLDFYAVQKQPSLGLVLRKGDYR